MPFRFKQSPMISFWRSGTLVSVLSYLHLRRQKHVLSFNVHPDFRVMAQIAANEEMRQLHRRWTEATEEQREKLEDEGRKKGMTGFAVFVWCGWYGHVDGMPD